MWRTVPRAGRCKIKEETTSQFYCVKEFSRKLQPTKGFYVKYILFTSKKKKIYIYIYIYICVILFCLILFAGRNNHTQVIDNIRGERNSGLHCCFSVKFWLHVVAVEIIIARLLGVRKSHLRLGRLAILPITQCVISLPPLFSV